MKDVFELSGSISLNGAGALLVLRQVEAAAYAAGTGIERLVAISKVVTFVALGAAVAGLTTVVSKGVDAFRDWELSMAELAKVTDPDVAHTVGYAIREMAKDMPLAHEALASIATAAGRMGVEGVENITRFTETVAQIGVATDISAELASDAFAKLLIATGDSVEDLESMGAAVNTLSNNFATSATEIVEAMARSANALARLNLTSPEIIGINAAMNEVSESSMRAGTALRNVVEVLQNPLHMDDLAAALGMTVVEFRNMREETPVEVIKELALRMNEGGIAAEELTGIMGESASRLSSLGANWEHVESAIGLANEQYRQATSLQTEYNIQASTFDAQIQVLKNNFHDIFISVGEQLVPVIESLIEKVQNNMPEIVETLTGLGASIATGFGWLVDHGDMVVSILGGLGLAFGALFVAAHPILALITGIVVGLNAMHEAAGPVTEDQYAMAAAFGDVQVALENGGSAATLYRAEIDLMNTSLYSLYETGNMSAETLADIADEMEGLKERVQDVPIEEMATQWHEGATDILSAYEEAVPGITEIVDRLDSMYEKSSENLQGHATAAANAVSGITETQRIAVQSWRTEFTSTIKPDYEAMSAELLRIDQERLDDTVDAEDEAARERKRLHEEVLAYAEEYTRKSEGEFAKLIGSVRTLAGQITGSVEEAWEDVYGFVSQASDMLSSEFMEMLEHNREARRSHKDELKKIREDEQAELDAINEQYSTEISALEDLYDEDAISFEEYTNKKIKLQTDWDTAIEESGEKYEEFVDAQKEAFKEDKMTFGELVKDMVGQILSALEKEIIATMIAQEAIALLMGVATGGASLAAFALAAGKAAVAIAAIEGFRAVTGLQEGGVVTEPTLALVGEGRADEVVLPLTESVFDRLGERIAGAIPNLDFAGGDTQNVEVNVTFENVEVRDKTDIDDIVRRIEDLAGLRRRSMALSAVSA